eukprot:2351154-Amphidinium_carterae.1
MAYKTFRKLHYNSEEFEVADFDEKQIELLYEDGEETHTIKIDRNATIDCKPIYAITVHKTQGMTIYKPYSIYEYNMMKSNMLYVALTRMKTLSHLLVYLRCVQRSKHNRTRHACNALGQSAVCGAATAALCYQDEAHNGQEV